MSDDQRLDMRYDATNFDVTSAHDIINNSPEYDLTSIFKRFGEERYAEVLARTVVEYRMDNVINTTGDLKECVKLAMSNTRN